MINLIKKISFDKNWFSIAGNAFLSVWSAFSITFLFLDFNAYSQFVLFIALFLFPFIKKTSACFLRSENPTVKIFSVCLSLLLAASLSLVKGTEQCFDRFFSSLLSILVFIFSLFGLAVFISLGLFWCVSNLAKSEPKKFDNSPNKKDFFLLWIIMFLVWLVFYLFYYPGIITPDSVSQIIIANGMAGWSNHHPVVHTLLIALFMRITGNKPVLYMLFQMLFMTGVFSYCCNYLRKKRVSKWVYYFAVVFFTFHPLNAYNGFTMVKDTLFGGFVLLFSICLCETVLNPEECMKKKGFVIFFIFSTLGVLFFRNNGFIAVALTAVLFPFLSKLFRIRVCTVLTSCLVLYFAITSVVYPMLNIAQSSLAESMAIPIQQIARVVYEEKELDSETLAYIDSILPISDIRESYSCTTVDVLKFHQNFNIEVISSDFPKFLKVWVSVLIKYPLTYVEAYLLQTQCLWDLSIHAGLIENFYNSTVFTDIRMTPFFGPIANLVHTVMNVLQFSSFAFITTPFWNIAVCYVAICICSLVCILKKQKEKIIITLPVIAVWISLAIAIPAALVGRYSYSAFTCLPLILGSCSLSLNKKP